MNKLTYKEWVPTLVWLAGGAATSVHWLSILLDGNDASTQGLLGFAIGLILLFIVIGAAFWVNMWASITIMIALRYPELLIYFGGFGCLFYFAGGWYLLLATAAITGAILHFASPKNHI